MRLNDSKLLQLVNQNMTQGKIKIYDSKGNLFLLENGKFFINGTERIKSADFILSTFLAAFQRCIIISVNNRIFIKGDNKWINKKSRKLSLFV